MTSKRVRSAAVLAILAAAACGALAQDRRHDDGRADQSRQRHDQLVVDHRYHHDRSYPVRGASVSVLPRGSAAVHYGKAHFYLHDGVWFRPRGGRFVVDLPPIGIRVPVLPSVYVTLALGGGTYYYANGVYYAPANPGWVVVPPPPGADDGYADGAVLPAPAPAPTVSQGVPAPVVYPRNGQGAAQTAADEQQCNAWAAAQPQGSTRADVQRRGFEACMDGRGYTVR